MCHWETVYCPTCGTTISRVRTALCASKQDSPRKSCEDIELYILAPSNEGCTDCGPANTTTSWPRMPRQRDTDKQHGRRSRVQLPVASPVASRSLPSPEHTTPSGGGSSEERGREGGRWRSHPGGTSGVLEQGQTSP